MTIEGAVILALGARQQLGTLEPGEEAFFDFLLIPNPPRSAPLSIGMGTGQGGYYTGYSSYYQNTGGPNTISDIMGTAFNQYNYYGSYNMGYGETATQQEERRRMTFLRAIINMNDSGGGRGTEVYLAGWTNTSPIEVDLKGAQFTTEDTSLYIYQLPVTRQTTDEVVVIPTTLLTWTPTDDSTRKESSPYGLTLQFGDRAVFRYAPLPLARLQDVTTLKLEVRSPNLGQGVISLRDWTQDKWVPIDANTPIVTLTNPQQFIGPENAVEVMIELGPGASLATYDKIDLTLSGHLSHVQ
jgi:hypothetical protein